jgi:alkanesulfonate monooxygenase SsuD/methylene tetrahydromethanopterin reductase-like flavin-dependent oxidoreductase (luciferase family)
MSGRALGKPHRAAGSQAADRVGYDTTWVAEHHFSNKYGIMPDVFTAPARESA